MFGLPVALNSQHLLCPGVRTADQFFQISKNLSHVFGGPIKETTNHMISSLETFFAQPYTSCPIWYRRLKWSVTSSSTWLIADSESIIMLGRLVVLRTYSTTWKLHHQVCSHLDSLEYRNGCLMSFDKEPMKPLWYIAAKPTITTTWGDSSRIYCGD
jgi:hypothetical protein